MVAVVCEGGPGVLLLLLLLPPLLLVLVCCNRALDVMHLQD